MRFLAGTLVIFAAALAGCSDGTTGSGGTAAADSGTAVADSGTAPAVDSGNGGGGNVYPPGPYGTRVDAIFRPFALTACNREGDDASWRFDQSDFFNNRLTVISIAAGWCVPCQRESAAIQAQIIDRYAGMGIRFVQILVQNADRSAITPSFCQNWARTYRLSFPVLMDPNFVTQPFVPNTAFPGNVIIDRQGRIRWREYGADMSLSSIRRAIDDVLANPRD